MVRKIFTMAASDDASKPRDLMAPDTDPTDEELAAVMIAARDLAVQRRALSDAWIAARLEEATRDAREHRIPRKPPLGGS